MTLTTRLLLFFLGALGVVLVGFSAALYLLARTHLYRQADERLTGAVQTLTAAAEVHPDGVEWEPGERSLGFGAFGEHTLWVVSDEQGRVVDRSPRPEAAKLFRVMATLPGLSPSTVSGWDGRPWLVTRHWVRPAESDRPSQPPAPVEPGQVKYPALAITVGVPLEPVAATLRILAAVLAGLSLAVFSLALVAGRAVCRRALAPVTGMAEAARAMGTADLGERLPVAPTGDELADLGESFNGLLDRLQESFERQRRFTGEASHQLRTPLTAILGQLEVALRRERPTEEYRRVLATLRQKAGHLHRIVESLLFLARADADARLPEREHIRLDEWLPAHLQQWSEHPRAADIDFAGKSERPCWVSVQPAMLGELLDILIDNACKHSPPESPITVRLRREEAAVCLDVEDRGYGIGDEDVPQLFTPFYRSEDARRRGVEGVGLGLSIAKRLADAFGGSLSVRSRIGSGSCFTLSLAAHDPAEVGLTLNTSVSS